MVLGDVHGAFGALNKHLHNKQPGMVLQCGDFGYWPQEEKLMRVGYGEYEFGHPFDPAKRIKNVLPDGRRIPIYWADGNHEDHPSLRALQKAASDPLAPIPTGEGIWWMPRGSSLILPTGEVVCFLGGARSVDRPRREKGVDWFPEELLDAEILDHLPERADIVISHTAPCSFRQSKKEAHGPDPGADWTPDSSCDVLEEALKRLRPSRWYFGHFHWQRQGKVQDCRWQALSDLTGVGRGRFWTWL